MKDPSAEIYDSFELQLATLTYGSKTVPVYQSLAEVKQGDYVLLDSLEFIDAIDDTHFASDCTMRIEIKCGPYHQQGKMNKLFAISSSIMQLVIKQAFTITGFTMDVTPFIETSRNYEERIPDENKIFKIKEIIIKFHVQET